jgi:two-component system sensor histidine kinase KdpD
MLAHEVRGPVASIKSLATTTLRSYAKLSDDERREFVSMIEQESSRLLETVTQSSLALKADARTLAFDLRIQPISAIVREGAAAADVRGHALEVTVPDDLRGRADRRWLAEAVHQLVDNAAKYSPTEAPIRVEATTNGADVTIDVIDQGPGVPPHRREEVFGRFVTWRPAGYEDRGGSGLGLFICRALVAEQGGQTALDGTPEGGTIARIRLPREG